MNSSKASITQLSKKKQARALVPSPWSSRLCSDNRPHKTRHKIRKLRDGLISSKLNCYCNAVVQSKSLCDNPSVQAVQYFQNIHVWRLAFNGTSREGKNAVRSRILRCIGEHASRVCVFAQSVALSKMLPADKNKARTRPSWGLALRFEIDCTSPSQREESRRPEQDRHVRVAKTSKVRITFGSELISYRDGRLCVEDSESRPKTRRREAW